VETTGGNPFYLSALIREAAAQALAPTAAEATRVRELGPEAIARLLLRRLDALGPGAPELARALAVLGDGATVAEAAQLAGLDHARATQAAHTLVRADIAAGHEPLAFAHPIVRTSIYADIAGGDRADQHRRAAGLLSERGADVDRVAAQLLAAGQPDAWAIEHLRAAATRALQRGAPENAAAYIRRALDGDVDPVLRLALLLELAGAETALQDPAAVAHLQQARDLAGDPLQRATITATLAELLLFAGQWDAAVELPRQALAELGDRDADLSLRLRTMGAAAAMFDPQLVSTLDGKIDELLAAALGGGKAGRSLTILLASLLAHRGERLDEIAALVEHGLDDGGLLADEHAESWVWAQAVGALIAIEAVDAAERVVDAMLADARARGSILGYVGAAACGLYVSAYRGAIAATAETVQEVLALAQEHGVVFAYGFTLRWGLDAILERPELGAVADFATTLELPPPLATTVSGVWVHEVRAALSLRAGDRAAAAAALHRAQPTYEALGFRNPSMIPWRSTVALATGDRALAEAELADARRHGLPRGLGVALRRAALISDDIALLEEAVAVLERSPARYEHARALVELGAARRRANQRLAAREPLRAGRDLAQRCGAIRLADRAGEELRATGARPRRPAVSGRDALTASERRVAEMAASGLSNPEIAQALFVTIKTVEGHLSGAYRKLEVRSRAELPRALAS
jgi:DNA-binding CsgD family transcriptional regulator